MKVAPGQIIYLKGDYELPDTICLVISTPVPKQENSLKWYDFDTVELFSMDEEGLYKGYNIVTASEELDKAKILDMDTKEVMSTLVETVSTEYDWSSQTYPVNKSICKEKLDSLRTDIINFYPEYLV